MTDNVKSRLSRTPGEIVERILDITPDVDWMATRRNSLVAFLDFEHAKQFLGDEVTPERWEALRDFDPIAVAREYLPFAIGKAANHRGLSAGRSIEHLMEWAWLSADPKFIAALDAGYPQYGTPILKAISEAIGGQDIWIEHTTPELERMALGEPCTPNCDDGCGE